MRLLKRLIIIGVILTIALATFINQFSTLISDFEDLARSKEAQINRHVDLSKGLVDLMAIYGADYYALDLAAQSELWRYLQYDAQNDRYNLDAVENTSLQRISGNLTGIGILPTDPAVRKEVNLALQMNHLFNSVYGKIPDAAWLYYTSRSHFINIYPWIASADFAYNPDLNNEVFYTCVTPDRNPFRESRWSPVYMDHAGKGLMVTLSSPVYEQAQDRFLGVVSLDLTNEQLSGMLQSAYETYLIDPAETVIANNQNSAADESILKLDAVMGAPAAIIDRIRAVRDDQISRINNYYYFSAKINNAPWKLVSRISFWHVLGRSALFTLPVFMIGLLLLLATLEAEKRKKTEVLLTNSLQELQSYHKMLENAAKFDFLTATFNRRGLMDIFNRIILEEPDAGMAVIISDIDLFKQFNDRYGHAAGDKVLIEITRIIQLHLGPSDTLCRWGGEEFVILLVNRSTEAARQIAESIRLQIAANSIPWENATSLQATMTFGVVEYRHDLNFEDNVAKADRALYYAKRSGRNRVIDYQEYLAQLNAGEDSELRGRHS